MSKKTEIERIRKLAEGEGSCLLIKENTKLNLKIWPQYASDVRAGIIAALEELKGGYNKRLGGLLLAYDDIKIDGQSGWITGYIHIHIYATFFVFAPHAGMTIKGVVNFQQNGKVVFLVLGKFNIVFYKDDYDTRAAIKEADDFLSEELTEGQECMVKLTHSVMRDFFPDLKGYPVITNSDGSRPSSSNSILMTPSTNGKKVRFSALPSELKLSDAESVETPVKTKKKKKKVKSETNGISLPEVKKEVKEEILSDESPQKKSKKSKKRKLDESSHEMQEENNNKKPKKRRKLQE